MVEAAKQPFLKKWMPLIIMGLAVVIIVLDTTLLNVSLGTIVRELNTNIQSLQWVITAYALTLAALTITGGRMGDLFGRKRMFIAGAVIFAIGSFIASISHNIPTLIAGESVIEGVGAALMMPATASLLVANYRGRDRALALGVWGGMAAAGSALGPVLGGYLTSHYSWRWGFRINVFVAAVLVMGSVIIKESRDREEKPRIDWTGVLLSATGLLAGVFAIIQSASFGWLRAKQPFAVFGHSLPLASLSIVSYAIVLSMVLLVGFFWWEQRLTAMGRTPLVNMKIFANKQFRSGAFLMAVLSIGQVGLIFGLPVFLQGVRGYDALHTGYAMLPMSFALLIIAPLGGFLAHRIKPKLLVQTGLVLNVIGLLFLRQAITIGATNADLILPMAIYGIGMGLCFSQLPNITLSAVSVHESGEASGVNNTLRQIGQSLGTAIIGSIIIASMSSGLVAGVRKSPIFAPVQRETIAQELGNQASALEFGGKVSTQTRLTSTELSEVKQISNQSTVKANKEALLITAGFTLLAFLLATQLPNVGVKDLEKEESLAPKPAMAH